MGLPSNFSFIWEDKLAGSAHPGQGVQLMRSLEALTGEGITSIVSLTEEALPAPVLTDYGFSSLHLPIEDFSPPTLEQIVDGVRFIDAQQCGGRGVVVHCFAGIGRTGTLLACFLVSRGMTPEEAIREVRRQRPGSVEVAAQELIVHAYGDYLKDEQA